MVKLFVSILFLFFLFSCNTKEMHQSRILKMEREVLANPSLLPEIKNFYLQYIQEFPTDTIYQLKYASFLDNNDMSEEAIEILDKLVMNDSNNCNFLQKRALIYFRQLNFEKSVCDLEKVSHKCPSDSVLNYYNIAKSHKTAFHSIDSLTMLIKQNSRVYELYYQRGLIFESINKIKAAKSDYKKVLTLDSSQTDALYYLAQLAIQSDSIEKALSYIHQALLRSSKEEKLLHLKKRLEAVLSMREELSVFEKQISREPSKVSGYIERAKVYARYKQYDLALKDLQLAMKIDPESPDVYYYLTLLFYRTGEIKKAEKTHSLLRKLGGDIPKEVIQSFQSK